MSLIVQPETWDHVDSAIHYAVQESAQILSRLRDVRSASDMISSASTSLHDVLGEIEQQSREPNTTAVVGEARRAVHASASTLKDLNVDDLVGNLRRAMRHMKELSFIAMMIRIDAARSSHAAAKSAGFATDLSTLVTMLDSTTQAALDFVGPINAHIDDAWRALQDTAVGLNRHVKEITNQKLCTAELQQVRDSHLLELSKEIYQISTDTATQISILIPRLQFADAFVQRLQNTQRFVEQAKEHPETTMQVVLGVAAQQIRSLCADTRVERKASIEALDALFDTASHSTKVMSDENLTNGFEAWLQANITATMLNVQVIKSSHGQLTHAFQKIDDAQVDTVRVSEAISKFGPLVQSLKFTAINGSLMASNSSSKTGASYVLTSEIQNIGKQCGQSMTDGMAALNHFNNILAKVERSEIEEMIRRLTRESDASKVTRSSMEQMTEELNRSRQCLVEGVHTLMEACRRARVTIQEGASMVQDLECLFDADIGMDNSGVSAADVEWIYNCYTTEPERKLHQSLFGGESSQVIEISEVDDDLADFML